MTPEEQDLKRVEDELNSKEVRTQFKGEFKEKPVKDLSEITSKDKQRKDLKIPSEFESTFKKMNEASTDYEDIRLVGAEPAPSNGPITISSPKNNDVFTYGTLIPINFEIKGLPELKYFLYKIILTNRTGNSRKVICNDMYSIIDVHTPEIREVKVSTNRINNGNPLPIGDHIITIEVSDINATRIVIGSASVNISITPATNNTLKVEITHPALSDRRVAKSKKLNFGFVVSNANASPNIDYDYEVFDQNESKNNKSILKASHCNRTPEIATRDLLSLLDAGKHKLSVIVTDNNSNPKKTARSEEIELEIFSDQLPPHTGPKIIIDSPNNSTPPFPVGSPIPLKFHVDNNPVSYKYIVWLWDKKNKKGADTQIEVETTESKFDIPNCLNGKTPLPGEYSLVVQILDNNNNVLDKDEKSIIILDNRPRITITNPTATSPSFTQGDPIDVTTHVENAPKLYKYQFLLEERDVVISRKYQIGVRKDNKGTLYVPFNEDIDTPNHVSERILILNPDGTTRNIPPGKYTLTAVVYDQNRKPLDQSTVNIDVVPKETPENIIITALPEVIIEGNPIVFNITIVNDSGSNNKYLLNVNWESTNLRLEELSSNDKISITIPQPYIVAKKDKDNNVHITIEITNRTTNKVIKRIRRLTIKPKIPTAVIIEPRRRDSKFGKDSPPLLYGFEAQHDFIFETSNLTEDSTISNKFDYEFWIEDDGKKIYPPRGTPSENATTASVQIPNLIGSLNKNKANEKDYHKIIVYIKDKKTGKKGLSAMLPIRIR